MVRVSRQNVRTIARHVKRIQRRGRVPRNRGMHIPSVYRYKQAVTGSDIISYASDFITQGNVALAIPFYFQLNDLPQVVTFQALYDQYRIDKIKLEFIPMASITMVPTNIVVDTAVGITDQGTGFAGANGQAGLYGTVIDYDDAGVGGYNLNTFTQYQNFKRGQVSVNRVHKRTLRPHVALATYGGAFTSYGNQRRQWCDCASPAVQHYGLKFYADKSAVSSGVTGVNLPQTWRILATYWVSFKNVR